MDQGNILQLVRTTSDQNDLINLIEIMLEDNYKAPSKAKEQVNNSAFMKNLSEAINAEFQRIGISQNRQEREKFLNALLLKAKSLNSLKISIAISPNEQLINSICKWAESNLSGKIVFDITVTPEILGGAIVINKNGEYADYSLLKGIDDFFLNQKQ